MLHRNIKAGIAAAYKRMEEILKKDKRLHEIVKFEIELVDSIPPDNKTGKTRRIISRVGQPRLG